MPFGQGSLHPTTLEHISIVTTCALFIYRSVPPANYSFSGCRVPVFFVFGCLAPSMVLGISEEPGKCFLNGWINEWMLYCLPKPITLAIKKWDASVDWSQQCWMQMYGENQSCQSHGQQNEVLINEEATMSSGVGFRGSRSSLCLCG